MEKFWLKADPNKCSDGVANITEEKEGHVKILGVSGEGILECDI